MVLDAVHEVPERDDAGFAVALGFVLVGGDHHLVDELRQFGVALRCYYCRIEAHALERFAATKRLIPLVSELKIPKATTRGAFTDAELKRIIQAINDNAETATRNVAWARQIFQHWFMIMPCSGMRTNDSLRLRWRDIEPVPG
jgi:integrase